ncbi:hypothetical protein [Murimonas intestini]|uniref:hypothetical protein n=1 Tax=Murimonas intestini TaxID=1337051 RepID=UPI00214AC7C1|nr:hypothetical protein [Murimonas intestini]MCR1838898.1 hypothetical protein [Murimonas intestini]
MKIALDSKQKLQHSRGGRSLIHSTDAGITALWTILAAVIRMLKVFLIFANLYEIFKISPYNEFEIKKGYERL